MLGLVGWGPRACVLPRTALAPCFSGILLPTESWAPFGCLYASERTSSYRGGPASRKCGSGLGAVFWEPLRLLEVSLDASTSWRGRRDELELVSYAARSGSSSSQLPAYSAQSRPHGQYSRAAVLPTAAFAAQEKPPRKKAS